MTAKLLTFGLWVAIASFLAPHWLSAQQQLTLLGAESLSLAELGTEPVSLTRGSLLITDLEAGQFHYLKADLITIIPAEKRLVATGHVVYTVASEALASADAGENLLLAAELHFELDSALLFAELSASSALDAPPTTVELLETDQLLLDDDARVFIEAKLISISHGTVAADGLSLTTCDELLRPHYQLKAEKMQLDRAKNLLMAQKVRLEVGGVPVFYLPYLTYGNWLFFNPVAGYRLREGLYLNTTTYLIGQKPAGQNLFSQSLKALNPSASGTDEAQNEGLTLALLADIYSRLGLFTGLTSRYAPAQFSLTAGLGFSHSVDSRGLFTNPLAGTEGSHLWGNSLPFRYGLVASGATEHGQLALNLTSDGAFARDFLGRSEESLFFGFLTLDNAQRSFGLETAAHSYFHYQRQFALAEGGAFTHFNIDYFNLDYYSQLRYRPNFTAYQAEGSFYVPSELNLPSTQLSLSGARQFSARAAGEEFTHDLSYQIALASRFFTSQTQSWQAVDESQIPWQNTTTTLANYNQLGYKVATKSPLLSLETGLKLNTTYQKSLATPSPELAQSNSLNQNVKVLGSSKITLNPLYSHPFWQQSTLGYQLDTMLLNYNYSAQSANYGVWLLPSTSFHRINGALRFDNGLVLAYIDHQSRLPRFSFEELSNLGAGLHLGPLTTESFLYSKTLDNPLGSSKGYGFKAQYQPFDHISFNGETEFNFASALHHALVHGQIYPFYATMIWQERYRYRFDLATLSWQSLRNADQSARHAVVASTLTLGVYHDVTLLETARGELDLLLDLSAAFDFELVTESAIEAKLGLQWLVNDHVALIFRSYSQNKNLAFYFNSLTRPLGLSKSASFWQDLADSLSFFNASKRKASAFKLSRLELETTVSLHDLLISASYLVAPQYNLRTHKTALGHQFSFYLTFKALPNLRKGASYASGEQLWQAF